jgi:predicted RecB family nuclease
MAGLQCHKLLWWMAHEPAAPELEVDDARQAVYDQGHRVGALARTYVPGGVLVDLPHNAYEQRLEATRQALAAGAPAVYEAAFRADGVFVSVDILERPGLERRAHGFCLTEVKSTTSVKEQHLADVAIQTHVVRRSGLDVGRMEVMHLNRACAYPDLSDLFTRADVTEPVEARRAAVPGEIAAMTAMLAGPLPSVATGPHCSAPYECPFTERCWPVLPPHHVSTLHAMRRRAFELDELGYRTIFDLPEDFPLGAAAERQRRAVQTGQMIVEPTLAAALARFAPPVAFLDFETVGLAIPVWVGCHPYDTVPVQFSAYVPDADGALRPHAWLAEGPGDPRPALAERLLAACEGARAIVAYNARFEGDRIRELAAALPHLATRLEGLAARLVDLLPVVRNHVYHPDFGGSFSLKRVLPVLVPELSYRGLAIADGETASLELGRLLFHGDEMEPEERARLRADLLAYCHQDTWGLVRLLERLRGLAGGA